MTINRCKLKVDKMVRKFLTIITLNNFNLIDKKNKK